MRESGKKKMNRENILEFEHVTLSYTDNGRCAAADISFQIKKGRTLALLGESGSGKTTVLKAILGLEQLKVHTDKGRILYQGQDLKDITAEWKGMLGEKIGMIFQNPGMSFNPIVTYRKQFRQLLKSHRCFTGKSSYDMIENHLKRLKLPNAEKILDSRPYEMSGGMQQRIAVAAAMLLSPELLLADEPTSALDNRSADAVLGELEHIRQEGTAVLLVTHNMKVAEQLADKIGVMYGGHLVEYGKTEQILRRPLHPYTAALLQAVPVQGGELPQGLEGQQPLYGAEMTECAFSERCPRSSAGCRAGAGMMREIEKDHFVQCREVVG